MPGGIGYSFSPTAPDQNQQAPPAEQVQNAIQVLGLRLPTVSGAKGIAPQALLQSQGAGGLNIPGGLSLQQFLQMLFGQMGGGMQGGPAPMGGGMQGGPAPMGGEASRPVPNIKPGGGAPSPTPAPPPQAPPPELPGFRPSPPVDRTAPPMGNRAGAPMGRGPFKPY